MEIVINQMGMKAMREWASYALIGKENSVWTEKR